MRFHKQFGPIIYCTHYRIPTYLCVAGKPYQVFNHPPPIWRFFLSILPSTKVINTKYYKLMVWLKKQSCSAIQPRSWHGQTAPPIRISHWRQNMVDGPEFLNPLSVSKTSNGLDHLVTWPNIWNLSSGYLSFSDIK